MKKTYGKDKGKKVFYATASKYGLDPSDDMKKKMMGMSSKKKTSK